MIDIRRTPEYDTNSNAATTAPPVDRSMGGTCSRSLRASFVICPFASSSSNLKIVFTKSGRLPLRQQCPTSTNFARKMYANNLNVFDVTNENARIKEQVSGIKIKSRIKDQGSRVKDQGSRIKGQGSRIGWSLKTLGHQRTSLMIFYPKI